MPPFHPPLPARALTFYRVAVPVVALGLITAAAITAAGPATPASAATTGTFTVGANPVELNQPTDPGMGALTPSADAAENGMFGPLLDFPVLPMHAVLSRTGNLISYGTPVKTVAQNGVVFDDWYPTTGVHADTNAEGRYDAFCNAAVTLRDGRILMVSGQLWSDTDGQMMTMLYDPVTRTQQMGADLAYKRWYPTALRLTNGKILLLGGAAAGLTNAYQTPDDNSQVAITPEIGTGTGPWSDLSGASSAALFGADDNRWWYPRAFNSPLGGVVGFSGGRVWTLDPTGNGSIQQVGTLPYDPKVSGSQVMYAPGKILIAGGGQVNNTDEVDATNQAAVLDVNGAQPTSVFTSSMAHARNWLNLTVLPNGEVLANGGTIHGTDAGDDNAVRQAEIWNPATGTWRTAATNQVTRTYHSTALVLPSGAVFTGGGGNPGPVDNFNGELYYPSYLFTKAADGSVQWASRPAIATIAGDATYGGVIKLGIADGRKIGGASLISMPSVTHAQNTDQRRIPLAVSQEGSTVSAKLPGSIDEMPPGDYELTVLDENGVASAAQIVTINDGAAGQVTVASGPATTVTAPTAQPQPQPATTAGTGDVPAPAASSAPASQPGTTATPVKLTRNATVSLESLGRSGYRIGHSGATVTLRKVGTRSSKSSRRASSWIVRKGLGSAKGYSLESVDRRGWYLVAPSSGASGSLKLVRMSSSSSLKKRATFLAVRGAAGREVSFVELGRTTLTLRTIGSRVVVKQLTEEAAVLRAATFDVEKALSSR